MPSINVKIFSLGLCIFYSPFLQETLTDALCFLVSFTCVSQQHTKYKCHVIPAKPPEPGVHIASSPAVNLTLPSSPFNHVPKYCINILGPIYRVPRSLPSLAQLPRELRGLAGATLWSPPTPSSTHFLQEISGTAGLDLSHGFKAELMSEV